jgi:hypothetical protein
MNKTVCYLLLTIFLAGSFSGCINNCFTDDSKSDVGTFLVTIRFITEGNQPYTLKLPLLFAVYDLWDRIKNNVTCFDVEKARYGDIFNITNTNSIKLNFKWTWDESDGPNYFYPKYRNYGLMTDDEQYHVFSSVNGSLVYSFSCDSCQLYPGNEAYHFQADIIPGWQTVDLEDGYIE